MNRHFAHYVLPAIASSAVGFTASAQLVEVRTSGDFMVDAFSGGGARIVARPDSRPSGALRNEEWLSLKTTADNAGGRLAWMRFDVPSLPYDKSAVTDVSLALEIERVQGVFSSSEGIGIRPYAIELWAIRDGQAASTINNVISPGTSIDGTPGGQRIDGSTPALTLTALQQGEDFDPTLSDPDLDPPFYNWESSGGPFPWEDGVLEGGFAGAPGITLPTVGTDYGTGPGEIPFNDLVDTAKAELVSVYYPTDRTGLFQNSADPDIFAVFSDSNVRPDASAYSGPQGPFVDLLLPENPGLLTQTLQDDTNDILSFVMVPRTPSDPISFFFHAEGNSAGAAEPTLRIVPEPASLTLLGLAGFAMLRRREA